jgi:hypothetical protein
VPVSLDALLDELQGRLLAFPPVAAHILGFQVLVGEEEVFELPQQVRRQVGQGIDVHVVGVGGGDAEDLVVLALVVGHAQDADGPGLDDHARVGGAHDQHQDVAGVTVRGQGVGDEAVLGRVVDGGVEHPVHLHQAGDVVDLVLDPGAVGDLHHRVDDLRRLLARPNHVQGHRPSSLPSCSHSGGGWAMGKNPMPAVADL